MIDLEKFAAVGISKISKMPVQLTHVRTLEEFDGPLLVESQSEDGEKFLYHWCDREKDVTRWLVVRTPMQFLTQYLVGVVTLRDLIIKCRDKFVYLLDIDRQNEVRNTFYTSITYLPKEYIPTEQSHYDAGVPPNREQQDVYVDHWGRQEIADYPRKFLQAYSFNALFGPHGDASNLSSIDYKLNQGWVYHTLFKNFDAHVKAAQRGELKEVTFASPGYARFKVNPAIASDFRRAIVDYLANYEIISVEAHFLNRWANDKKEETTEATAKLALTKLCSRLNINSGPLLNTFSTAQAIKALMSYLRRLDYIAEKDKEKAAMLVGLERPILD